MQGFNEVPRGYAALRIFLDHLQQHGLSLSPLGEAGANTLCDPEKRVIAGLPGRPLSEFRQLINDRCFRFAGGTDLVSDRL